MSKFKFTESEVEEAALYYFEQLGYTILIGGEIAPEEPQAERTNYQEVILENRLRSALAQINPQIPSSALDEVVRQVLRSETQNLFENNRRFHRLLTDGVPVSYQKDNRTVHDQAWLIDWNNPKNNDWLVVNQFTVIENNKNHRPDVVVFINGLPLAVIELKNAADENADIDKAYNQLQTYKRNIPSLFTYNEALIVSDGIYACIGSITADRERFMPWRTIDGSDLAPKGTPELEVVIRGVFEKTRFLDLIRFFIVFEIDGETITKKMAGYHQYHAVNKAVAETVKATSPEGDKRVGVIWHTQGSGKSLSMAFYAGKIVQHPAMANPTLVVLTDRNDLDDQLLTTFSKCQELLRQQPVQAEDRSDLKAKLQVASGGVIFTTIQKFAPEERGGEYESLSDRRNIVFIADEAHRSQYGLKARVVKTQDKETGQEGAYTAYGFAKYLRDALPNASFIGFTGTPIDKTDASTKQIFGDYIDIYDIQRAVEDGATVKIYYEARLAKIALEESEKPKIDSDFAEVTKGEEQTTKDKLKSRWAQLEAMVGTEKRLALVAQDILNHFDDRLAAMEGKGIIVCMSRRICAELYKQIVGVADLRYERLNMQIIETSIHNVSGFSTDFFHTLIKQRQIVKLRPQWHSDNDSEGEIKVVMTGNAADPEALQPHIRSKKGRDAIANRLRNPQDSLKLVIRPLAKVPNKGNSEVIERKN